MDKPPDNPAPTSKPQSEVATHTPKTEQDTPRIATAEDFKRAWERAGRPRRRGILAEMFQLASGNPPDPLEREPLSNGEAERLGELAEEGAKAWALDEEVKALTGSYSWEWVRDSMLKLTGESPDLVGGLLPAIRALAGPPWKPSPEIVGQMAGLGSLPAAEPSPQIVKQILESMRMPSAFEAAEFVVQALSQGAIRYIRQTSPRAPRQRGSPVASKRTETPPEKEEPRAEEKPIPPESGKTLVETAAQSLALLDAELGGQATIVRTPAEWKMLRDLKAERKMKEISRWLSKSAQQAIRYVKQRLEIRRGRKPKAEREKEGFKLALEVAAVLPDFEKGMRDKKHCHGSDIHRTRLNAWWSTRRRYPQLALGSLGAQAPQGVCRPSKTTIQNSAVWFLSTCLTPR